MSFFTDAYDNPLQAALAFKAAGGKVVGYMTNNVPVELIHAAGAFPLQLPALPGAPTPRADVFMEPLFDPMVRSVFERILGGEFDFLDLIVLPRSVDSYQRFYYYLCEVRRSGAAQTPEPFLYDLLKTPYYSSAEYNFARTSDLRDRLQQLTGKPIVDAGIAASIDRYNAVRARLGELAALRGSSISGETAFLAYAAVGTEAIEAVDEALAQLVSAPDAPLVSGPRVILVGSAHDQPVLHRLVSQAGGEIVADHHWRGDLLLGPPIETRDDPLRALSDHYHRHSFATRSYPASTDELVALARRSGAEAALFFYFAEEEALVWDYPAQAKALQAAGLRTFVLNGQAYPPSLECLPAISRFLAPSEALA